jgi:hypothetical protein
MNAYWMIRVIIPFLFSVGLGLILLNLIRGLNLSRVSRVAHLRRYRIKSRWQLWLGHWREREELTASGRKLKELLKLSGNPMGMTVFRFQVLKLCMLLIWTFYLGSFYVLRLIESTGGIIGIPIIPFTIGVLIVWFVPDLVLMLLARRRKTIILFEISRLSHRLSLCITEKSELREVIQRAGRTLTVLKPYLHELSVQWNKNQYEAIQQLGRKVGLTEIYPLVNTLVAVSHVDRGEVAHMLEQQVSNIDKTLEHEIQKKIENAPLLIIFLIMIPFLVVFVLMIYPWIAYLSDQLSTSFGGA